MELPPARLEHGPLVQTLISANQVRRGLVGVDAQREREPVGDRIFPEIKLRIEDVLAGDPADLGVIGGANVAYRQVMEIFKDKENDRRQSDNGSD